MKRSERNWTIVSLIYRDVVPVDEHYPQGWKHRLERYVVLTGLKSEAEKSVRRAVAGGYLDHPHEVHYYPRNYVDDYRALRAAGRVIELR